MFQELDIVRLKVDDHEAGVLTSFLGTIVDVHAKGHYTVEFINEQGETIIPALYKVYTDKDLIKA